MTNYCGNCKHARVTDEFPEHRRQGLFNCIESKPVWIKLMEQTECEKWALVADLTKRKEDIRRLK